VLDAFERALRKAGSPAVNALAPGLTDRQIDAHIEPLGLTMPEEARRWWRWRDG
jgi:hypothetical protein